MSEAENYVSMFDLGESLDDQGVRYSYQGESGHGSVEPEHQVATLSYTFYSKCLI